MQAGENTQKPVEALPRVNHGDVTNDRLTEIECEQTEFSERKSHRLSGLLHDFWRWISEKIVQDVPEDSAICAFDCKKEQCTAAEWDQCDRRLTKAAGELWPAAGALTSRHAPADQGSRPQLPAAEVETK